MNDEVTINFVPLYDKYHWHVSCGNWQVRGYGEGLEDAEYHAFKTVQGIPNHGTIHTIYNGGKEIKVELGNMLDSFVKDNNEKE